MNKYTAEAIENLKKLIATPSFSSEEDKTAEILIEYIESKGIKVNRIKNNFWIKNDSWSDNKITILLNSHHDTVKPNKGYTRDPFSPDVEDGTLYGLGSNDAGGSLVSMLATFLRLNDKGELPFNLIWAASAEEETTGKDGIELLLTDLPKIDFGIVGEPSKMEMAIAEKGLMVLDCTAHGKSGHAARNEGINAIYKAMKDIEWFMTYEFPKVSEVLGKVKMSVTQINAGVQHNVVPKDCSFVVDVRSNELYSNKELHQLIQEHVECEVKARSYRINSTGIALDHPLIKRGLELGRPYYGSPTTSDKALMPFPTLKMGPGDSARSHTADEYIHLHEIEEGVELYIQFLTGLDLN